MKSSQQHTMSILAFDYGRARIGVACGNTVTQTAMPLSVLRVKNGVPNWREVQQLIDDWQPALLLVGLPIHMDGSVSLMAKQAQRFASRLQHHTGLSVKCYDERLSSKEAALLAEQGKSNFKAIDDLAACVILRSWFQRQ